MVPGDVRRFQHKEPTDVTGQCTNAEKDGIGLKLTAWHPMREPVASPAARIDHRQM